jgi:DNA transposition AAA+ family ATPase
MISKAKIPLLRGFLNRGDRNSIAIDLGVSANMVSMILAGRHATSARILEALYTKAKENAMLNEDLKSAWLKLEL